MEVKNTFLVGRPSKSEDSIDYREDVGSIKYLLLFDINAGVVNVYRWLEKYDTWHDRVSSVDPESTDDLETEFRSRLLRRGYNPTTFYFEQPKQPIRNIEERTSKVLSAIQDYEEQYNKGIPKSQLQKATHIKVQTLDEIAEMLEEDGRIVIEKTVSHGKGKTITTYRGNPVYSKHELSTVT